MSRKWCKSIVYVVLVSFIALLLPKALWHDCNHQDHQLANKKHLPGEVSVDQGIEKCAVCDLHVPLLSNPIQQTSTTDNAIASAELFAVPADVTHSFPLTESHRGPPVEMS